MLRHAAALAVALIAAMRGGVATASDGEPIRDAVFAALDDERRAIATYERMIEAHGERPPLTNIVRAERRHEAMLLELCAERGFEPPPDRWAETPIEAPVRFDDACDVGAASEIENVAVYDRLLEVAAGDERVRTLFERLRAASQERHLPAFRRHGGGWETVAPDAMSDTERARALEADAAREAMFGRLLATLADEIGRAGAAGAIAVCQTEAPRIAQAVGEERGVAIGRTSWRLRNPENTPPAWAVGLLQDRPAAPVRVVADDGRLGVLHPIILMGACVQCHGDQDDLAPGVADALAQRYPGDEATGFAVGDLRGWFWVQVPAR